MLKVALYITLSLAVLMVAFVTLERTSSPFFQRCIAQQPNNESNSTAEKSQSAGEAITVVLIYVRCSGRFIDRHDASITALATIIIAAFTFTLWRSTDKLWKAGETEVASNEFARKVQYDQIGKQIEVLKQSAEAAATGAQATRDLARNAERTAEQQLRAYLSNGHANIVNFDSVPIAQVLIKNAGQTPAYNVIAWNAVQLAPFPLGRELAGPLDAERTRCNLGPGMDFHMTTPLSALPPNIRASIRAGTNALYVFGRADYIDAFGQPRILEWRMFYGADSARRADGALSVHPEGNSAN